MIGRVGGLVIHPHRRGNQRHVVHNCADHADDQDDQVEPANVVVEPLRERRQDVGVFEGGHGEQDANEEHQRTHVDL